jgi:hypothetical protein
VDTKPISDYFHFGLDYWYLRQVEPGYEIHNSPDINLDFVLDGIESFMLNLDELNLQVTRRAARDLVSFQKTIEKTEKGSVLDEEQAERLRKIMEDLEKTLLAELEGFNAYVVTPKRIDVTKLQTQPHLLFAPMVFKKLPPLAQFDIGEAGKCIVFELSTAAAFHLMRATEAVLREYYHFHVSRNRVKPLLWGSITKDLQSRNKFQKDEKHQVLLKNLDNIRLSFRNPTQHPDKVYDIQEVQDLWGLCVDVINRMASELPMKKDSE